MGRGRAWAAPSRYVLFSQILIASGRGWASASEAGSARLTQHQARISVAPCCVLCFRPGGACTGRRRSTSAPAGKPGTGRDRKATPLQADGSACDSCAAVGGSHFWTRSCSLGSAESVWAAQKAGLPVHSGRADRLDPTRGKAGHHHTAGSSQQQERKLSGGLWATRTASSSVSRSRPCAPALARAVMRYVMG